MKPERSVAGLLIVGLVAAVCLGAFLYLGSLAPNTSDQVAAQRRERSKFRLISEWFGGDNASYTFQTPPEEKNFADDCIGCEQEVGNAVIFAEFGCAEKSKYLFESNSENKDGVAEKTPLIDKDSKVVGEQRLIIYKDKGKVVGARMFWIEGEDFWAVQAPTVSLTKALKESNEYKDVRKKVAEEIKSYVPIQNANTRVKKPCFEGKTQRRVLH